jgi:hypothetical protein
VKIVMVVRRTSRCVIPNFENQHKPVPSAHIVSTSRRVAALIDIFARWQGGQKTATLRNLATVDSSQETGVGA